jgi:anti-sigma regulatory factor (Ser/Thr protein kinase)
VTWGRSDALWPSVPPPPAEDGATWELHDVAELPGVRAQVRRLLAGQLHPRAGDPDEVRDRLVLALDEMASNALRHGGGRVTAALRPSGGGYLVEVSDRAPSSPPVPAVGRDPSQGGLGLYLIAELALDHGWYVSDGRKTVWAVLPRS